MRRLILIAAMALCTSPAAAHGPPPHPGAMWVYPVPHVRPPPRVPRLWMPRPPPPLPGHWYPRPRPLVCHPPPPPHRPYPLICY